MRCYMEWKLDIYKCIKIDRHSYTEDLRKKWKCLSKESYCMETNK